MSTAKWEFFGINARRYDFVAPGAPNAADSRLGGRPARSLHGFAGAWFDMRQIGPEIPSAPTI